MRWHFLVTAPADGPSNMALDEALMRRAARTGDAVFRVYGWSRPTLSLGRNQRARGCYDETAAQTLGIAFVRRPTGGRALLHDHEITYSVTMPAADSRAALGAYDFINEVLLGGLARLGVPAGRATGTHSLPPGLRPCFDVPAEREIAVDGRKLVGSAQWRHAGALLQHGSILVRDDQSMVARLLKSTQPAPPAAATLADALGWEPSVEQVAEPIREMLMEAAGAEVDTLPETALDADAAALRRAYEDDAWTWRR
jgi:lipoyl(octanoyl) transferase